MLARLYLIVDDVGWIERLLPHGLRLVQLRIKDQPEEAIRRQVRRAKDLCAVAGAQLVVNDWWRIAIDEGCDFVHLGQEDLAAADLDAIRGAGLRIGVSTHDLAELARALAVEPDYVALGPIFATTLKELPWAPQGLDKLRSWKALIGSRPLVAIGGMTPTHGRDALAAGAGSVAVASDVLRHPDPERRLAEWRSVLGEAGRAEPAHAGQGQLDRSH